MLNVCLRSVSSPVKDYFPKILGNQTRKYAVLTEISESCLKAFQAPFELSKAVDESTRQSLSKTDLQSLMEGNIHSLQTALSIHQLIRNHRIKIWDSEDKNTYHRSMPPVPFPFGLWYRGHADAKHSLIPSAMRSREMESGKMGRLDESSTIRVFQNTFPEEDRKHLSTFEWLTTMQHYSCPTRLLDWSESLLVGLFFCVNQPKHDKDDGVLWIMNAHRLNRLTSMFDVPLGVGTSRSFNATIRAEMAMTNDYTQLFRRVSQVGWEDHYDTIEEERFKELGSYLTSRVTEDNSTFEKEKQKLSSPVAVVPRRISDRLKTQSGVFTVYGGKVYRESQPDEQSTRIAEARDLATINREEMENTKADSKIFERCFLLPLIIPSSRKKDIRDQLNHIGIHEGSIYAGMDDQSRYIAKFWTQ